MQKNFYFLILCTCVLPHFIKGGHYLLCDNNKIYCGIIFSLIAYEYDIIDKPYDKNTFKFYDYSKEDYDKYITFVN